MRTPLHDDGGGGGGDDNDDDDDDDDGDDDMTHNYKSEQSLQLKCSIFAQFRFFLGVKS